MFKSKNQSGQGVTEYLILVGIIAIGSMWVISKLGESIRTTTGNVVNVLTDQDPGTHRDVSAVSKQHMGHTSLWQSVRKEPKSNESR